MKKKNDKNELPILCDTDILYLKLIEETVILQKELIRLNNKINSKILNKTCPNCNKLFQFPSRLKDHLKNTSTVYLNFLSRTVFTSLIFIFVRASSDYLLLPIINGLGSLIACFGALYIVFARHKVPFKKQKLIVLKKYLQDSFAIFLSNSAAL